MNTKEIHIGNIVKIRSGVITCEEYDDEERFEVMGFYNHGNSVIAKSVTGIVYDTNHIVLPLSDIELA